jgi:hypothetical protein
MLVLGRNANEDCNTDPQRTPKLDFPNDKIAPVTVMAHSLPSDLNQSWVQQLVDEWSQTDDVFRHEFLQNIIFLTSKEQKSGIDNIRDELRASLGTEWSTVVQPDVDEHDITSGPFVMWNGQLCKAFRLYDDPQQAFVVATKPHFAKGRVVRLLSRICILIGTDRSVIFA